MIRPKPEMPRGVLHLRIESTPGYGRYHPAEDLAPFVEHFWTVEWDLDEPAVREVLPHPSVRDADANPFHKIGDCRLNGQVNSLLGCYPCAEETPA